MERIYLVSGASGHLGSTLVNRLLEKGEKIRALVLAGEEKFVPEGVEVYTGDVRKIETLKEFFHTDDNSELIVLHCAGIITIASKENPIVHEVNVEGTRNILEMALKSKVKKMVHVASVHAIKENENGEVNTEPEEFCPDQLGDQYARSKAEAVNLCIEYAKKGLDVSYVMPSGIFGPGDVRKNNHTVRSINAMFKGLIPIGIEGGFDFVDVRDAAEGIILCSEKGRKGDGYILSGHYIKTIDLVNGANILCGRKETSLQVSYKFVRFFAPFIEKVFLFFGNKKPLVTPYSIDILNTNGHFSHEKATRELGYQPREVMDTLRDMKEELKIV